MKRLQLEREITLSSEEISKAWLFKEAAKLSNVVKYGTLKNSCINYIENRIGHLFSGIIAHVDFNNNLNFLVDTKKEWIREFWMEIFKDEVMMDLSFAKAFLNSSNSIEKMQFLCSNNTRGRVMKLPFSWLIKEFLDKLTHLKIKEVTLYTNK